MHADPILSEPRVLIIEDEALIAEELRERLSRLGITVIAGVSSGEEGVEIATRERPDLVLMDIRLSGKKDGVQAAAEIRERVDIPIVYMTAHSDRRTVERANKTAHDGFILKPLSASPSTPSRFIEEPDVCQLNLRLALTDTTVKYYTLCLIPQADDPELTSRSTSISA